MALEKRRSTAPEIEEREIRHTKAGRNRRPTVCSDQRRQWDYCGICGFGDLAFQGVDHCERCGKEEVVVESSGMWTEYNARMRCCTEEYTYHHCRIRELLRGFRDLVSRSGVRVCLSCGAVEGPKCPSCGRACWARGMERYCKACGYRRAG